MTSPHHPLLPPHALDRYLGTLWRNRDFRTLWLSLTITHFGGQVTLLALPLTAAILLHATPVEMGILVAMEALPYTLLGLFTGVLVDRSRKLRLIIQADIGRGLVLLLVPIAAWGGFLSMSILYVVGFLVGLGGIIGWAAYQVFMAERVGRDNLVEANSRIALSDSASQLIGPGLAGAIIHALTAPIAILLDAISFFASAFMLRTIKSVESDAPKLIAIESASLSALWQGIWMDVKEGLSLIRHSPILRSIAVSLMLWNFLKFAYLAIVILFATRDLGFSAGQIGTIFMTSGIGFLLASAGCQRLNKRFGIGSVMLAGLTISGCSWLLVAAVSPNYWPAWHFGGALFLFAFGAMIFFINYLTLRQAATPDHLRGRVTSTLIFLAMVLSPLGSLLGGFMGEYFGLRTTIAIVGVGGLLLGVVMMWTSPLRNMKVLPEPSVAHTSATNSDAVSLPTNS
jgi:MFS family permease